MYEVRWAEVEGQMLKSEGQITQHFGSPPFVGSSPLLWNSLSRRLHEIPDQG